MPYPNEHALRLKPPAIFDPDSFRRTAGGKLFGGKLTVPATIGLIWAKLKGRAKPSDPPILQAIRFKKSSWTVAAAKSWIKKNIKQSGAFEPAASSTAKSEELTEQDKEQDILFGDYDAYDNAEVVKFEELGDATMTLDDIEDEVDPEAEARKQYIQLMAAYDEDVAEGKTQAVSTEETGQEDTATQDYAAAADGDDDDDKSTYDVPGVEVMAVGTWNNDVYKQEDLDLVARNFSLLKAQVKPPLVLGHGEQKLLEASGLPAAGWVSKLRRVGNKLLADFSDVPRAVANIIKNKGYKRVSVEIYPNYQAPNGIRFGLTLARIALLGTDIPAIKTLKDVEALYSENSKNQTKEVVYMAAEKKEDILHEEVEELEEEQEEQDVAEETPAATPDADKPAEEATSDKPKETTEQPMVMAELRQMKANYDEMKSKVEASSNIIKVLQDQVAQQKAKAELAYDEKFLDDMTAEGKLPPAVRSKALTLMGQLRSVEKPLKYTELDAEGKEVEKEGTVLDVFKDMVDSLAVTIDMAETAKGTPAEKPGVYSGGQGEQFQKDGFPVTGLDTVDLVEKRVKELREANPGKTDYEYTTQALLEVSSK